MYGKPKRIIQAHLHAIFYLKLPHATSLDLSQFRSVYEGHLRGLKTLGVNISESGYVFAALLILKLPLKIRDNINRAAKSDFRKLEQLRAAIDIEIGHLQSTEISDNSINDKTILSSNCEKQARYSSGTAIFNVTTNSRKCPLCDSNHSVFNCEKFKSVDLKRQRISQLKMCFNCLRVGHIASNCTNAGRCKTCHRKHHSSICVNTSEKGIYRGNNVRHATATNISAPLFSAARTSETSTTVPQEAETSTATSLVGNSSNNNLSVALPRAVVAISVGNRTFKKRLMLDQGSQR